MPQPGGFGSGPGSSRQRFGFAVTVSHSTREFKELGREPCLVCGHKDRCKADATGDLVLCFRTREPEINGFRLLKHTRGCSTYVRIGSAADRGRQVRRGTKQPRPALDQLAAKYAAALTDSAAKRFALELGVTVASLGCWWRGYTTDPYAFLSAMGVAQSRRSTHGTRTRSQDTA